MFAALKRQAGSFLHRMGWRKHQDHAPRPCESIDYDALFDDVSRQYPTIMKRLASR